jgi:hypothetical protein
VAKLKVRTRNNGKAAPLGHSMAVPEPLELAALEDLGPLTRRAICESPLPTLAVSIVEQIIDINDKIEAENKLRQERGLPLRGYVDPKNPELDRRLAIGVVENVFKIIAGDEELGDRALDWAKMGVRPLIARPSSKTARERRKTEGRRFRGW